MKAGNPKARKAPAAPVDPVFAAIAGHRALIKEARRLEDSCRTVRAKAEKRYGKWTRAPHSGEWPGETIVSPFYDRWHRVSEFEYKAARRLARTVPTSPAGAAALIVHVRRTLKTVPEVEWMDWVPLALKTVAAALLPYDAPPSLSHPETSRAVRGFAADARGA